MLMKEYCFIDDYIISNYICFLFLKAISEAIFFFNQSFIPTHNYDSINDNKLLTKCAKK